jgi:AraC-like DNA-binding protein
MRSHYKVLNSASELAKKTHLDPAYLSRMFKHFQKESPYAFLVRLKMGHAASLLIKPDTLVKDVAYELGFDNPSHFSRSFKKFYGISPEGFIGKSKR